MLKERKSETELDKIVSYFSGEASELPASLEPRLKRINHVYSLITDHRDDTYIVNSLMRVFGIRKSQAYQDIKETKYVHGSFLTVDKGFELYQQLQECLRAVKWAVEQKDLVMLIKAIEARTKVLSLIPDKEDVPWDKINPSNYFMLVQLPDGSSSKLNLKTIQQLPKEETERLMYEISQSAMDATFEELESHVRDPK